MSHFHAASVVAIAVILAFAAPLPVPAAAETLAPRETDDACPEGEVPEEGFDDVADSNVHEQAIDCAVWRDLAHGRTDDSYAPGETLARAQNASFAERLIKQSRGELPARPHDHFDDDDGSVHHDAINRLAEASVVSGRAARTYAPGSPVSRGQLATILVRAIEYRIREPLPASADYFSDDDGGVHEHSINKAAEAGLVEGTSDRRYEPRSSVRRDQLASFLVRAYELFVDMGYGRACAAEYPPYIRIAGVVADPPGDDVQPDDGEYVELLSDWCDNVELDGWYVRDADGNAITISADHVIQPGTTFRVYTGPGQDSHDEHYAGREEPVWDDDGDTATLYAPDGTEADTHAYQG